MNKDFMCPVCKSAPLITDYCPNCSRIEGHTAPPDAFPQAHRLALELECLLLSCQDNAAVSKWWDSAHEALEQWRQFCAIEPAPQQQNEQSASEVVTRPSHCEGATTCKPAVGAAPLPDEVREIVERLRAYPTRDGLLAADMIERLARQVPEGCVVVPRNPTLEMRRAGGIEMTTDADAVYRAMIDAWEVKP